MADAGRVKPDLSVIRPGVLPVLRRRLEAATGPDLVLNWALYWPLICAAQPDRRREVDGVQQMNVRPGAGAADDWRPLGAYQTDAPNLTGSIDEAAQMLEAFYPPASYIWTLRRGTRNWAFIAAGSAPGSPLGIPVVLVEAPTAPIALMLALVTALNDGAGDV